MAGINKGVAYLSSLSKARAGPLNGAMNNKYFASENEKARQAASKRGP
jgi:hypothetical protein